MEDIFHSLHLNLADDIDDDNDTSYPLNSTIPLDDIEKIKYNNWEDEYNANLAFIDNTNTNDDNTNTNSNINTIHNITNNIDGSHQSNQYITKGIQSNENRMSYNYPFIPIQSSTSQELSDSYTMNNPMSYNYPQEPITNGTSSFLFPMNQNQSYSHINNNTTNTNMFYPQQIPKSSLYSNNILIPSNQQIPIPLPVTNTTYYNPYHTITNHSTIHQPINTYNTWENFKNLQKQQSNIIELKKRQTNKTKRFQAIKKRNIYRCKHCGQPKVSYYILEVSYIID